MSSFDSLSNDIFKIIYKNAFKKDIEFLGVKKLSGGYKNRVYLLDDGNEKYILKIEPSSNRKLAPVDKNVLWWEAKMLKEVESLGIYTPKLIYYSNGIDEYNHPFIVMTYLEGNNYSDCLDNLSIEQKKQISYDIGNICYKISSNKKDSYYLPAFPDKKFKNNYNFVLFLFKSLLNIYKKNYINVEGITYDQILDLIISKEKELNNVESISLCNIDVWDGNILVKNGKITGIVDFADTFYCDELMNFYFHLKDGRTDEDYLLGYNRKVLTYDEKVRIEIYRLYSLLKTIVDCEIKNYGRFGEIYKQFSNCYNRLCNM